MYHIGPDVSFGSKADLQRHAHLRLLSGVKQTSNVRFLSPARRWLGLRTEEAPWRLTQRGLGLDGPLGLWTETRAQRSRKRRGQATQKERLTVEEAAMRRLGFTGEK